MIEVTNLKKCFGKVQALRGVTFSAPDGKITGLLGPNGAGKTTTLRVLYTVLMPDEGSARIDGFDVCSQPHNVQKCIGALPDAHGLYPRMTARENIRYYGRLHGLRGPALENSMQNLIDLLDMGEFADRRTDGFSSGQRVKVSIARALIHNPQNILLDEPTNGLDVMATRAMRAFICHLRSEGKCILFSSHIMQEVAAVCDNIIIIDHGQVVACGSADELRQTFGKEDLEDAFVAALGSEEGLL